MVRKDESGEWNIHDAYHDQGARLVATTMTSKGRRRRTPWGAQLRLTAMVATGWPVSPSNGYHPSPKFRRPMPVAVAGLLPTPRKQAPVEWWRPKTVLNAREESSAHHHVLRPPIDHGIRSLSTRRRSVATDALQSATRGLCSLALATIVAWSAVAAPAFAGSSDASRLIVGPKYWTVMESGTPAERVQANMALMDYSVGTINTMYYDVSGGVDFDPRCFFHAWRQRVRGDANSVSATQRALEQRSGVEENLQWLVAQLGDPYSKYLTRQELRAELTTRNDGFLGLGAMVDLPGTSFWTLHNMPVVATVPSSILQLQQQQVSHHGNNNVRPLLSAQQITHLPVVTALAPDSPAERAGLTVGDRILAVNDDNFRKGSGAVVNLAEKLDRYNAATAEASHDSNEPALLTLAKPVYATSDDGTRQAIVAYRPVRVKLRAKPRVDQFVKDGAGAIVGGGNRYVHYELLNSRDSIWDRSSNNDAGNTNNGRRRYSQVGYIRLTRFSRASTQAYLDAVAALEKAGASSYILDLRNNYGGVIQEAMLTASTLLRDPHAVLCYTMNARGGFTPHDVQEYVADHRYPGYLLSREAKTATRQQVQRESPFMFRQGGIMDWHPPSAYASLHEQHEKRHIRTPASMAAPLTGTQLAQLAAQKNIVLLINEGTASSAEVFASALHDNGRTVALVGTKSYGKGLIQHTFPLPDGGGLRLTVAEYLTPSLHHVTHVGGAQWNRNGEWVGGGIRPDIYCASNAGIPSNVGADLCVGMALDALEEARADGSDRSWLPVKRMGGADDGSRVRRAVWMGVVRDDF